MYYYRPTGIYSAKIMADEERKEREKKSAKRLAVSDESFSQISNKIMRENPNIVAGRLKEFYDQIIKGDGELLKVNDDIKEIYVKLLNFQVPKKAVDRLTAINGELQYIRGYNEKQSKNVNMDYFSVRIDKMPTFGGQLSDVGMLFKKIRDNFLTLSKGTVTFESNCDLLFSSVLGNSINGSWEFIPYPKTPKEELNRWEKQLGATIFKIKAGGGLKENLSGDDGAVLESEISQNSWIFTTVFTPESETQPFSGHRQFGIHQDEEGNYRFFARAVDRIWPSEFILRFNEKECTVLDYLTIADATWNNLIQNVSKFVNSNKGKTTIMPPEIKRINFNLFFKKFRSNKPVNFVGNIEQFK
jgi:uncharacterized protein (UPF0335 family)